MSVLSDKAKLLSKTADSTGWVVMPKDVKYIAHRDIETHMVSPHGYSPTDHES